MSYMNSHSNKLICENRYADLTDMRVNMSLTILRENLRILSTSIIINDDG